MAANHHLENGVGQGADGGKLFNDVDAFFDFDSVKTIFFNRNPFYLLDARSLCLCDSSDELVYDDFLGLQSPRRAPLSPAGIEILYIAHDLLSTSRDPQIIFKHRDRIIGREFAA